MGLFLLVSAGVICHAPFLPTGTIKCMHLPAHSSNKLNLFSAIILPYLGNIFKKTGFRVSSLPLTPPKYPFDTNVAGEFGATQNKNLSVLWCLYFDQVALCSSKLSGFCIIISEQSVFQCLYLFCVIAGIDTWHKDK